MRKIEMAKCDMIGCNKKATDEITMGNGRKVKLCPFHFEQQMFTFHELAGIKVPHRKLE